MPRLGLPGAFGSRQISHAAVCGNDGKQRGTGAVGIVAEPPPELGDGETFTALSRYYWGDMQNGNHSVRRGQQLSAREFPAVRDFSLRTGGEFNSAPAQAAGCQANLLETGSGRRHDLGDEFGTALRDTVNGAHATTARHAVVTQRTGYRPSVDFPRPPWTRMACPCNSATRSNQRASLVPSGG